MSDFLNPLNPDADDIPSNFYPALQKSWSKESCWVPVQSLWQENNPSLGNCFVSVLALWAATDFKGEVVPVLAKQPGKDNQDWHFLIRFGDVDVDLTRQQFLSGTEIKTLNKSDPMYDMLVKGSVFDATENRSLRVRLRLLLQNLNENGYTIPRSADEIINRLEQKFTALRTTPPERGL